MVDRCMRTDSSPRPRVVQQGSQREDSFLTHMSTVRFYLNIASFSLIYYYHSLFYSLGLGSTIGTSYCTIVILDNMVPTWPSCGFCQTIVQYDVTIVQYIV